MLAIFACFWVVCNMLLFMIVFDLFAICFCLWLFLSLQYASVYDCFWLVCNLCLFLTCLQWVYIKWLLLGHIGSWLHRLIIGIKALDLLKFAKKWKRKIRGIGLERQHSSYTTIYKNKAALYRIGHIVKVFKFAQPVLPSS